MLFRSHYLTATDLNGSTTATDLGLTGSSTGSLLHGTPLISDICITLRDGTVVQVNLAGAETVGDAIATINAADSRLYAELNAAANGIDISDATRGDGNLAVANASGSTAATDLGIAATGTEDMLHGKPLLKDLRITLGGGTTLDVSIGEAVTVGDVLAAITNAHSRLTAAINYGLNGINITDSGGGMITVQSLNGCRAAEDLGIAATRPGTLTGSAIVGSIVTTTIIAVQNAIGGSGDDLLIGSSANNQLTGGEEIGRAHV